MAKILVAEDERDIRDLIEFTLKLDGHEVIKAANGVEAVALAAESRPDLILLDVRMPRMTGYDACRAIKAMNGMQEVPVVFLSAKGQQNERESGLEAGANAYILKPFAPDDLNRRIAEILAKFSAPKDQPPREAQAGPADPGKDTP